MTDAERTGLEALALVSDEADSSPAVAAAVRWIERQLAAERRRRVHTFASGYRALRSRRQ